MGHRITAFIGQPAPLKSLAEELCHTAVIALAQGYYLLPLFAETLDACNKASTPPTPAEYEAFDKLVPKLIFSAQAAAQQSPIAYVETDYFGGVGSQAAILWDGATTHGPYRSETTYTNNAFITMPEGIRAINRVLLQLGVAKNPNHDEFDTLGLGRFRSNEAWAAQATEV